MQVPVINTLRFPETEMKLACRDVFCHHYNCVSLNAHIASLARAPSMQPHQTVFVLFFLSFSAFLSYLNSSIICFYWMTENMSIHNEKHYIRVLFHCISCYFKEEEMQKRDRFTPCSSVNFSVLEKTDSVFGFFIFARVWQDQRATLLGNWRRWEDLFIGGLFFVSYVTPN